MAMDQQPVSRPIARRRYAPKTRAGCITCKIRRVKCDEGKPSCLRCTKTGRTCDGYGDPKPVTQPATESITPALAFSTDMTSNTLERRIFDFFKWKTLPGLAGYFQDTTWDHTILQIAQTQPAMRYAANALGALHEEIDLRKQGREVGLPVSQDARTSFPMRQYTLGMKELRSLLTSDKVPINVVLLVSMCFMHFEALHESFVPALVHMENAIKLLKSPAAGDWKNIDPGILESMRRLDLQSSLYLGMRVPGLPSFEYETRSSLPTHFRSANHARNVIAACTSRLLHFMRTETEKYKYEEPGEVPIHLYQQASEFEQVNVDLDRLCTEFVTNMKNHISAREARGVEALSIQVKINKMSAATCLLAETSAIDRFKDDFEKIIFLCNQMISEQDLDSALYSASLHDGQLSPLFFVATQCRDGRIRRKSLDLIKRLHNGQRLWYIEIAVQIIHVIIQYEEGVCNMKIPQCEDIPEQRRVHKSTLGQWDISVSKITAIAHLITRPNGMDGEWGEVQVPVELCLKVGKEDMKDVNGNGMPALMRMYPITGFTGIPSSE